MIPSLFNFLISYAFMFYLQHKADKERAFKGVISQSRAVDLMILDIPDGLPVPGVSSPTSSIPPWNILPGDLLKSAFDFANNHLHDDGAILIFHSDASQVKSQLKGFCKAFHFKVFRKWMGINCLHLTSSQDSSQMVEKVFHLSLFTLRLSFI